MPYKDGTWGEKAQARSKARTAYFNLRRQKRKKISNFIPKGCIKRNARQKVRDHVRTGKMTKPTSCESCGEEQRLEGHHHDYSKPLDVVWLCKPCHVQADKLVKV